MGNKPLDPADQSIKQSQQEEADTYEGQQGYGVEFEDGQYQDGSMQEMPEHGRSGSFETNNEGGYGTGQPDAEGHKHTAEQPASPPDPEASVGQGGQ